MNTVKEMLEKIAEVKEELQEDWFFVGVRFEDKNREVGETVEEVSRHNKDREDERDFPDFDSEEYQEMEELDGISTWSINADYAFTPFGSKERTAKEVFGSEHAYILVSDDAGRAPDDDILDDGEILLKNAEVAIKLY